MMVRLLACRPTNSAGTLSPSRGPRLRFPVQEGPGSICCSLWQRCMTIEGIRVWLTLTATRLDRHERGNSGSPTTATRASALIGRNRRRTLEFALVCLEWRRYLGVSKRTPSSSKLAWNGKKHSTTLPLQRLPWDSILCWPASGPTRLQLVARSLAQFVPWIQRKYRGRRWKRPNRRSTGKYAAQQHGQVH